MNPRDRRQRRASERTILHANSFLSDNASFPRLARLAGGAGSARPRGRYWLHPGISLLGYRAILNGCGGNEMSRSMCSLATRTHGVRPSEKTAFRVIWGLCPPGDRPFARPSGIMTCPGSCWAAPCGRAECIPPRKPASALSPGFPRKATHFALGTPWRGGLRTPARTELASPEHAPFGHQAFVSPR